MNDRRVLILGGTAEARALAQKLREQNVDVVSSLAGRVSSPRLPVGDVRIGGFGGVDGLVGALRDERVTHLVDATHPFAVGMRQNAVQAAGQAGIPIIRLARPGWGTRDDASAWHWVSSYADADATADELGQRPFLTSGRQTLKYYKRLRNYFALVRLVEPPAPGALPNHWTVLLSRGPFETQGEIELMQEHRVDVLITKDSGGDHTSAKLDAAAALGVPVVVVSRPPAPDGLDEVPSVEGVLAWFDQSV